MKKVFLFFLVTLFICCSKKEQKKEIKIIRTEIQVVKDSVFFNNDFIAFAFDFPIGKPNGKGYYNAQKFQENNHLGDDWNAVTGGNSDLGNPIYAIADGYVSEVKNYGGGWGNVIRLRHRLPNKTELESLYAHCDTILAKPNSWVKKGVKIATIGNANGAYLAHLHFEIRDKVGLPIGPGYSSDTKGYLNPTKFIKENRKVK